MAVVAVLTVGRVITEAFVQRRVLSVLFVALLGIWEYRLGR